MPTQKNDAWSHAASGLGMMGVDKSVGAQIAFEPLDQETAELYWRCDDIMGRIIETLPEEMTREGHDLVVPTDLGLAEAVEEDAGRLGIDPIAREALTYARAFGGGGVLLGVDDGLPLIEPLDLSKVKTVTHLTALTPKELRVRSYHSTPFAAGYGTPETYDLTPWSVPVGYANSFDRARLSPFVPTPVHASRVWRFDGVRTSRRQLVTNINPGWGDSVLMRVVRVVQSFQLAWQGTGILLQDFAPVTLKMAGLADIVANGEMGVKEMGQRAQALELCRGIARVNLIDSTESYERTSVSLAGLADALEQLMLRIAGTAEMPVGLLMGQSPSGLGAGAAGDADIRWWFNRVRARQNNSLVPYYKFVYGALFAARGDAPDTWSAVPRSLWQRTANEEAALRKTVAETDAININAGVLTPDEVARNRFGGDAWTMETTIDPDDRETLPPEVTDEEVRKDSKTRLDYIKNVKGSYLVYSESGKILGKHPTKVAALKQLRAIEANK